MKALVPAALLLVAAAPAPAQSWEAAVLALHNRERTAWRVPPLAWDLGLAAGADRWAYELARTDRWGHSPKGLREGQGENLWMGSVGAYPISVMVGAWIDERRWFRPGMFPAVSRTGNWADVGHYTQMISSRSQRIGCAIRSNRRWSYLVCRYSPSGNVYGMRIP